MGNKIKISILVAISIVLMHFRIGLPIFPSFLDFDLSDVPIFFIGLTFSPILSVLAMGIKNILIFLIIGSFTYGIGEIANFLMGSCFVFVASYIYHKIKEKKGYFLSFILGMSALVIAGTVLNYFIILPTYFKILGVGIEDFIGTGSTITKFLILYIVPYNIIKSVIIFFPTMFIFQKFKKINSRN